ncbi:MAG: hypothetical protein KGJ58_00090 [Patescibacteria group bacterium]|nr:hypothetical protein [Patescibacteria group bacterium]MDE2217843.1 hypothetical protein [Patescibacteria group bacterium]
MMEMNLPKIRIKYNRFLDPIFTFYCKNNPELKKQGWNDWIPPEKEKVLERVKNYNEEWIKYENKILSKICEILGLNFERNIIDVHIVSGNPRQFSNPIIIKSGFSPDEFVDVLTHELLHVLFQDNIDIFPIKILNEMFQDESKTTKNHIITHAVLKFLYLDILKDRERLERNILNSKKHNSSDYTRAWEIVEEKGYREVIDDLKKRYHSLI